MSAAPARPQGASYAGPSFEGLHPHRDRSAADLVLHTTWRPALVRARRAAAVLLDWPERSHRAALRNAMVASTDLLDRRIERDEVESYLSLLDARRTQDAVPAPPRLTR